MFIQSIEFATANDFHVTGYIWQRYDQDKHRGLSQGFVLPEAVGGGGSSSESQVAFRRQQGNEEVVAWRFDAMVRQWFDYTEYPLDHKTVWIRLYHEDLDRNVVLVPDLAAYDSTLPGEAFGIDHEIVLGRWDIEETFFLYRMEQYDTNFGVISDAPLRQVPELYFNVVLRRKVLNAFIINLVPLFVCAALLFAMLLTVTADDGRSNRLGFNASAVIGAASALFFVVILAHVQLRDQFATRGIVYIEQFYFLMYLVIVGVVANTYLFSVGQPIWIVQYRDNLIPKVVYWPSILLTMIGLTLRTFLRS